MPSLWGPEPQEFVGSGDCPCGWLRIAPSAGALPDTWLTAEPPYHADLTLPSRPSPSPPTSVSRAPGWSLLSLAQFPCRSDWTSEVSHWTEATAWLVEYLPGVHNP